MKFTSLTIDQFQRITAIEMTAEGAEKQVAVYAVVNNLTLAEAKKISIGTIAPAYKRIEAELKDIPKLRYKHHMKIGKQQYRLSLYTDKLSAGQLLEIMSYNMTNEYEVVQSLHLIMASLTRERKWFRTLPYDGANHAKRAELMKQATMGDVWGAVSFFLMASEGYMQIMQKYSEANLKTMVKELASLTNTDG
jgi:hypothetical protein